MKKNLYIVAAIMILASTSVIAQSSNNQDEVVKIEQHSARLYRPGEMIVKFKTTSAVQVRTLKRGVTSGMNSIDKVLGELGVTASEALMPLTGAEVSSNARALRSVTGKTIEDTDMSRLYRLTFDDANVNVHKAIEKIKEYFSKNGEGNLRHEVWIDTSEIKADKDWLEITRGGGKSDVALARQYECVHEFLLSDQ